MPDESAPAVAPTAPAPEPAWTPPGSQAELDRIIGDRLARQKQQYADYDDIKARAAQLDELEAANATELEKAQKAAADAAAARDQAVERANGALLRAAITNAASKANAVDPDDVFALLDKSTLTVGDDGQVSGVQDAVKALLEAKPHLVGKPAPVGSGDGGPQGTPAPGQLTRDDLKTMSPEEVVAARKAGRLNDLMGVT